MEFDFKTKHIWCIACSRPYSIWAHEKAACPKCHSTNIVSVSVPVGQSWREELVAGLSELRTHLCTFRDDFARISELKVPENLFPKGILSLGDASCYYPVTSGGEFYYQLLVSRLLKNGFKIYSVKNAFGEILTVGDETNFGKIKSIIIYAGAIVVWIDELMPKVSDYHTNSYDSYMRALKNMNDVHPKKKSFLTEDGFNVYAPEVVCLVHRKDWTITEFYTIDKDTPLDVLRVFNLIFFKSSNAQKFVDQNEPRFSKRQIWEAAHRNDVNGNPDLLTIHKSKLKL